MMHHDNPFPIKYPTIEAWVYRLQGSDLGSDDSPWINHPWSLTSVFDPCDGNASKKNILGM